MLAFSYLWIWLLAPAPWLVRWLLPPQAVPQVAVRVPFGERLQESIASQSSTAQVRSTVSAAIPVLIWLAVLAALARPQWIQPPITRDLPTRDLLLLVDLSGSMQQEDFTDAAGDQVSRLTAVKEVVGDFLERREGDRVGLVVFGDAPYLQAPFSTDLELSRSLLDEAQVGMAGPRTAFGDAIGLGINLFDSSEVPAKTIIALTDGNDTKSQVPPLEAARVAANRGITIHTVAVGDPTTVGEDELDEEALREVASATDGSYFFAQDRESLIGIYQQLDDIETHQVNTVSHRPKTDLFYLPLLAALLLSIAEKAFIAARTARSSAVVSPSDTREIRVDPMTGQLEWRG